MDELWDEGELSGSAGHTLIQVFPKIRFLFLEAEVFGKVSTAAFIDFPWVM